MARELKPYEELSRTGKKYRDDPEYREAMKEYSMDKVKERRKERLKEKRNYTDDRDIEGGWKPRVVDGVVVYNNTTAGEMVNATRVTMCNWMRDGILPEPTVIDELGRRWFSKKYIDSLRKVLKNRLRGSLKVFKKNLKATFLEDGIIDKEGNNIEFERDDDKDGADESSDSVTQSRSLKTKSNM